MNWNTYFARLLAGVLIYTMILFLILGEPSIIMSFIAALLFWAWPDVSNLIEDRLAKRIVKKT